MIDLPSRYQLGDSVRFGSHAGVIDAITFCVIDGQGKVCYDISTKMGLRQRVLSENVQPGTITRKESR